MYSVVVFLARVVTGFAVLFFAWFVFDSIHDRNVEIIASLIGLQYSFIFVISRRLEYFGLTLFSFFGRTVSYIRKVPYDHVMREEIGALTNGRHLYLNIFFASLLELLCLYRLLTSLLGRGWPLLSDPITKLVVGPLLQAAHDVLR